MCNKEPRRLIPSTAPIPPQCGGKTVVIQQLQNYSRMLFGQTTKSPTATQEAEFKEYYDNVHRETVAHHEAFKQQLIQVQIARAAYKLGRYVACNKEIKDHLAKCLAALGLSYSEIQPIIRNMVEGLKNV